MSAAPQRKQLYLDKAESRLQAPYSNSQAASRKGDRGAPDSGVCRAVRAAVRTDGAGCPALTDALLRRAGAALPDSAAGRCTPSLTLRLPEEAPVSPGRTFITAHITLQSGLVKVCLS